MLTSIFLAKFIGIFCLVMGLSMIARRRMLLGVFHELSGHCVLSYILGVIIFLMGLALVLNHNIWAPGFPLAITILGWFVFIEGLAFIFGTEEFVKKDLLMLDEKKIYYFISTAYLVIGAYLTYFSFIK